MFLRKSFYLILAILSTIEFSSIEFARADELTFEEIKQWVASGEVKSVEQLLAKLPPKFRETFSLVFNSRSSQQDASLENPRAIVTSPDRKLTFTFNGDPSQKGFNSIELIEWNKKTGAYNFNLLDFQGGIGRVHENPQSCVKCHAGRPIWDSYPLWPGTYSQAFGAPPRAFERNAIEALSKKQPGHPRYGFFNQKSFNLTTLHYQNSALGEVFQTNIFEGVVAQFERHPDWPKLQAIVGDFLWPSGSLNMGNRVRTEEKLQSVLAELKSVGYEIPRAEFDELMTNTIEMQDSYMDDQSRRYFANGGTPEDTKGMLLAEQGDRERRRSIVLLRAITKRMGIPGPETWQSTMGAASMNLDGIGRLERVLRPRPKMLPLIAPCAKDFIGLAGKH